MLEPFLPDRDAQAEQQSEKQSCRHVQLIKTWMHHWWEVTTDRRYLESRISRRRAWKIVVPWLAVTFFITDIIGALSGSGHAYWLLFDLPFVATAFVFAASSIGVGTVVVDVVIAFILGSLNFAGLLSSNQTADPEAVSGPLGPVFYSNMMILLTALGFHGIVNLWMLALCGMTCSMLSMPPGEGLQITANAAVVCAGCCGLEYAIALLHGELQDELVCNQRLLDSATDGWGVADCIGSRVVQASSKMEATLRRCSLGGPLVGQDLKALVIPSDHSALASFFGHGGVTPEPILVTCACADEQFDVRMVPYKLTGSQMAFIVQKVGEPRQLLHPSVPLDAVQEAQSAPAAAQPQHSESRGQPRRQPAAPAASVLPRAAAPPPLPRPSSHQGQAVAAAHVSEPQGHTPQWQDPGEGDIEQGETMSDIGSVGINDSASQIGSGWPPQHSAQPQQPAQAAPTATVTSAAATAAAAAATHVGSHPPSHRSASVCGSLSLSSWSISSPASSGAAAGMGRASPDAFASTAAASETHSANMKVKVKVSTREVEVQTDRATQRPNGPAPLSVSIVPKAAQAKISQRRRLARASTAVVQEGQPRNTGFAATPKSTRWNHLCTSLRSFNITGRGCCMRHILWMDIYRIVAEELSGKCGPLDICHGWQCPQCLALNDFDASCVAEADQHAEQFCALCCELVDPVLPGQDSAPLASDATGSHTTAAGMAAGAAVDFRALFSQSSASSAASEGEASSDDCQR